MADGQMHINVAVAAATPSESKTKINTKNGTGSGDGEDDSNVKTRSTFPFEFPPGFRFNPHDDELIIHYLRKKVLNQPLPYNNIVDVDLYKYNPDQLIEKYSESKTKINTKNSTGSGDGEDDSNVKRRSNIPFEFPPGFRFNPHDDELIIHYLRKKVLNQPLPYNNIVDVDLYKYNPDQLIEKYHDYGEKDWYFFTPRDRKYRNGSRPNRSAGDGYWKATGADKPIKSNDQIIGCRKALVFYRGKPTKTSSAKTNWIMHEYRLQENLDKLLPRSDGSMRLDNCVLCRIHRKPEKKERPTEVLRRGDGQMTSADALELGDLEFGDIDSTLVHDYKDTKQPTVQNDQVGVFNIPIEYGAENWTSLPLLDFGQQYETLRSPECMNNVGPAPYTSFLTSNLNAHTPLTQVATVGKLWGKEEFYLSKSENYDLSSQIDIYDKSVLNSQPLLDAEELVTMLPSTETPRNT